MLPIMAALKNEGMKNDCTPVHYKTKSMNKLLLFLLAVLLIWDCQNVSPNKQEVGQSAPDRPVEISEVLEWNDLKINGKFPLEMKAEALNQILKMPKEVASAENSCGTYFEEPDSIFSYGETIFEKLRDSVALEQLNFRDTPIDLAYRGWVLNQNTALEEFKLIFPKAEVWESHERKDEKDVVVFRMATTGKILTDDCWFVTFKNGKLLELTYWFPC